MVMKVAVVGGGPAGLYFALLAKRRRPACEIVVHEQNPQGSTYGFGVILADRGLQVLRDADRESHDLIVGGSFVTRNQVLYHQHEAIFIESNTYGAAIGRLRLLSILEGICRERGVTVRHDDRIAPEHIDADLIVGADGVNSSVRERQEEAFGTTRFQLRSKLAWYGCRKHFAYPLIAFRRTAVGAFVAVAYPYSEAMSTFVVECDPETWVSSGLAEMTDLERTAIGETVFADLLEGAPLIANRSIWRSLSVIRNREWSAGNIVLLGDALHSAHPSIGSGTRIAMEDAIALADALADAGSDTQSTFQAFRAKREPGKRKLLDAMDKSVRWFDDFPAKLDALGPVDLAFDYLQRTGRVTEARLQSQFAGFVAAYGHRRTSTEPAVACEAGQTQ